MHLKSRANNGSDSHSALFCWKEGRPSGSSSVPSIILFWKLVDYKINVQIVVLETVLVPKA